jgi:methylamine dehydrogenase accessory protein MauD
MEWSTVQVVSHLLLWVVVLVQAVLLLALARLVGQLMNRRFPAAGARVIDPGPEIGAVVDGWEGTDLVGRPVQVHFPRERGVFLLYVSPHCTLCAALLPPAKRFFKEIAAEAEGMWAMVLGTRESQIRYAQDNELTQHRVLTEDQLPSAWRLGGGPFGLWIGADGEVKAKGMVNNREHLESLREAARLGHPSLQSYLSARAEQAEQAREHPQLLKGP